MNEGKSTAVKKRGRSGSSLCSQAVHVLFFHAFIISGFIFPAYAVVPTPIFFRGGGGGNGFDFKTCSVSSADIGL